MEIKGIGIDLLEIDRIKTMKSLEKFIARICSQNEIERYQANGYFPNTIAGDFAAKEAILKSLGTGLRGMKLKEIEISRDELGKPYVVMTGNALKKARELGIEEILISISHSEHYAVAQAMAMG